MAVRISNQVSEDFTPGTVVVHKMIPAAADRSLDPTSEAACSQLPSCTNTELFSTCVLHAAFAPGWLPSPLPTESFRAASELSGKPR